MKEFILRRRDGLTILLALLSLSAALTHGASAQGRRGSARGNNPAPARCRQDRLSVRRVNEDAAMGGVRTVSYAFTNNSSSPCSLEGYPRFEVLNGAGRVVRGGRASDGLTMLDGDARTPPHLVTIEPGKAAAFLVYYNAGGAGRMKPCPTYRRVRITPPGAVRGFVLREPLQLCGELQVSPVGSPAAEGL